jgi:hypothetical protein
MRKKQWQAFQSIYGQSSRERRLGGNIAEMHYAPYESITFVFHRMEVLLN